MSRLRIVLLSAFVSLTACTPPATFQACAVTAVRGQSVLVTVEIHNLSSKKISSFEALLTTDRALTGYTFHSDVAPREARRVTAWQVIEKNASDPRLLLGRASSCQPHRIEYSDGSH